MDSYDRIVIQGHQQRDGLSIGHFFNQPLHAFIDSFHLKILRLIHPQPKVIGNTLQRFLFRIRTAIGRQSPQITRKTCIVRIMNNDFLAEHVTNAADTYYLFKPIDIGICIQYHRIVIGFIGKKSSQRRQYRSTGPHAHPHNPFPVTSHLITRIVNDIVNNKYQYGYHYRHTQPAFANDASKRGTDKKEDEACQ